MSKRQQSPQRVSKRPIRVDRGGTAGADAAISVSWTYEHECGRTVWLRPSSGIEIAAHPKPSLR
jgi:hypothetical protein